MGVHVPVRNLAGFANRVRIAAYDHMARCPAQEGRPPPLSEVMAPVQALLHAPSARSVYAVAHLRIAAVASGGKCIQLGVREREVPLPLGWMLSELAQRKLNDDLAGVSWKDGEGPVCDGAKNLECSCEDLVTRVAGDAELTSRTSPR